MKSGIYMIQNIVTGDRYIGSSRNLKHRRASHFSEMKNGDHGNYKIRRDCKKYGVEVFKWFVVEIVEDVDRLVEREQFWLDTSKPEYNVMKTAQNH